MQIEKHTAICVPENLASAYLPYFYYDYWVGKVEEKRGQIYTEGNGDKFTPRVAGSAEKKIFLIKKVTCHRWFLK